jgi:hypothetical protein
VAAFPLAGEPGVLRRIGEPPTALCWIRGQPRRPFQRVGSRSGTTATSGTIGRILQFRGHALIRLHRRCCQVPSSTINIPRAGEDLREFTVDSSPAGEGGVLVDGRADERMPELQHAVPNRDQTGSFRLFQRIRTAARHLGAPEDGR